MPRCGHNRERDFTRSAAGEQDFLFNSWFTLLSFVYVPLMASGCFFLFCGGTWWSVPARIGASKCFKVVPSCSTCSSFYRESQECGWIDCLQDVIWVVSGHSVMTENYQLGGAGVSNSVPAGCAAPAPYCFHDVLGRPSD